MEARSLKERFLIPVLIIFCSMAVSFAVYNLSWRLENNALHQILASIFGTLYFVSVLFGPIFVYCLAYFRGAGPGERILASYINPFVWATKEGIRLLYSFSVTEALYYYLNPLNIWFFFIIIMELGLAELTCRKIAKHRGEDVRVFSVWASVAVIMSLVLMVAVLSWGMENVFAMFLEGYRWFFGSGV